MGQTTLTATANRVSLGELSSLLGLDFGLRDGVADVDLRLRGGGRTTRDALNSANGAIDIAMGKGTWPPSQLASWPPETLRLLGGSDAGVPFNCIAGRFEVSGGVANLRRLVVDTPRGVLVGGGYLHLRTDNWEFMLAPEARDHQNAPLAVPMRIKGGPGKATASAVDPNLSKLLVGGGPIPSLVAQVTQAGRQARRQCLRRAGAARRSPATGPAGTVAGAHVRRPSAGVATAGQTPAPQRSQGRP